MFGQAPSPRSTRYDLGGQVKGVPSYTSPAGAVLSPGRSRRHRTGSNQGSRSGSPLTLQMDTSGHYGSASDMSRSYLGDGLTAGISPVPSPGSNRSPFQSPAHSRSSSMTSVKSLLRDRSVERGGADRDYITHHGHYPTHHHDRSTSAGSVLIRDRSLDRQLDRHYRDNDKVQPTFTTATTNRDRSLDREYPHMGARSLERGENHHPFRHGNLVRSRSIDHEYMANQAAFMPSTPDLRYMPDGRTLILDLQGNVAELTKECFTYQQELDATKEKLSSSMNSIKTFWSPELKKERVMRKEDQSRMATVNEQFRVISAENEKYKLMIQQMEEDLRAYKMARQAGPGDYDSLQKEKQKAGKETRILRKTVEEMELRIETQKQTLVARDESIKKLLEMLQSKGLVTRHLEEDRAEVERLQLDLLEEQQRGRQQEAAIEQREGELAQLREYINATMKSTHHKMDLMKKQDESRQFQFELDKMRRESGTEALHATIESKDLHIQSLESEVKVLEDELLRLREEGTINGPDARNGKLQFETLKSQEKLLKAKIENLKAELKRKDTELAGLRAQVESFQRQGSDHQQHIAVLREQISAKDQQVAMLQADLETMRARLDEKDALIDKKGKQVLQAQTDRKRAETELIEARDHMDIKDRKVNVIQRKVDNLEELLREKDGQLALLKQRLNSLHADHNSSDSTVTSLEEQIMEREKQIERLKEQRDRADREHVEEVELLQRTNKELKSKVDVILNELDEKQHHVLELREESSDFRSEKIRKDNRISQLELALSQKSADIQQLSDQIKKLEDEKAAWQRSSSQEAEVRTADLEKELTAQKELASKTQTELDRLLEILKQMEEEKHDKDKHIKDLQEQVKENKTKAGTLRRSQQKSAQMLEEARKRQEEVSEDVTQLKNVIKQNVERIEELEEALRESVKITAQREMVMAEQQMKIDHTEKQMKQLSNDLQSMQKEGSVNQEKISSLHDDLQAKETQLKATQAERRKQLEGLYEMKQEAIVAAISEKDAHIALLEMAPGPKPSTTREEVNRLNKEKDKLQEQLKELTQSRMKLLQIDDEAGTNGSVVKSMAKATPEQVIRAIRGMEYSKKRLRALIDQLVATCLDIDPQLLEGLPRIQQDLGASHSHLQLLDMVQLLEELRQREGDCTHLQDYINTLLQRIREVRPETLISIMEWLDRAVQR